MWAAYLLSFAMGFISLSQEILWVRYFGFANQSLPQAFAFVLAVYLVGIALGARVGKWVCGTYKNLWEISGYVLLAASFYDLFSPWIYAHSIYLSSQIAIAGVLILLTAAFKAIIFPIAHHLGAPAIAGRVGRSVSRVYVANIIGATLGPFITGMILLDVLSTQNCFFVFAISTLLVALFCLYEKLLIIEKVFISILVVILSGFVLIQQPQALMQRVAAGSGIKYMVENRHGIVTVYNQQEGGDVVFGGNVYDGRTNLDPIVNTNGINRVLVLSVLQDKPKHVLLIGLSIGTWLKLLTSFPGIEQIDVVEINPGYLEAMRHYPAQYSALSDPRVHLYIDDGRRWLRNHRDQQYDLIVMNTTWHWRAYATSLLSREFLVLAKQHLNAGGVMAYNSTDSLSVLKTAAAVFEHAYPYENFVVAADFDWRPRLRTEAAVNKLMSLRLDGKPLFPVGSEAFARYYLNESTILDPGIQRLFNLAGREGGIITDRNLLTEYKLGRRLIQ